MTKRRRVFDLPPPEADAPDGSSGAAAPDEAPARRSPMAAAIAETAGSLRDRATAEAAIRAENDHLAAEHVRLLQAGLVLDLVALDAIDTDRMARDRDPDAETDGALDELILSIRETGLSNPIRVEPRADGRYGLVQGLRRLTAYRRLLEETGDSARWGRIAAAMLPPGQAPADLYRRMVDENMVRKDISFAEMARLAIDYAADPGTPGTDPDAAVSVLYRSAGYQKRSYIRAFIPVVAALGSALRHAPALSRALGLALAQRLQAAPETAAAIRADLAARPERTVEEELDILRRHAGAAETASPAAVAPVPGQVSAAGQPPRGQAASDAAMPPLMAPAMAPAPTPAAPLRRFQVAHSLGMASCIATGGRLEIRLGQDFPALDPHRLDRAVRALLDELNAAARDQG